MLQDLTLLERHIGKLHFKNPLLYGGGTMKTFGDVTEFCKSEAAGGELGTITPKQRDGNTGKVFFAHREKGVLIYTLNSLGMPNPGRDLVSRFAVDAVMSAHACEKLLGANIAGDTPEEILDMVLWALEMRFDWITINAGCPNKWKIVDGNQVPQAILSFDTKAIRELMHLLETKVPNGVREIWWKPSPDNDTLEQFVTHAEIVGKCSRITGWVANNTVPHCFGFDYDGAYATITPGGGLAGMGGPAVKPKAMGDIRRLKNLFTNRFTLIGAGGVTYGPDIQDFGRAGAHVVQFTSALWANGMRVDTAAGILEQYCSIHGIEDSLRRMKYTGS